MGLISFILLIIGTLGLLSNEFIFNLGRLATLIFAIFNVIGLTILIIKNIAKSKNKNK